MPPQGPSLLMKVFSRLPRLALPIDSILSEVVGSLATCHSLIVQASPGSGKTTRIPAALLSAPYLRSQDEILVLEPRRLAAKWAARRVADELGETIGQTIGYRFRFENVGSARTRLRFLTEGMLMRQLLSNPSLTGVGIVVLDEFHERHLHGDLALAYLKRLQTSTRPDLRIVIMSATLDTTALQNFFGRNTPVIQVSAALHPVDIENLPAPPAKSVDILVRDCITQQLNAGTSGDFLVFLPGMAEIRKCADALTGLAAKIEVLTLHGDLSREEQDRAMAPTLSENAAARRRVILSTNIAETSLTIPGVSIVIDSGLHRVASHSHWSGIPALRTRPISRASAIQRAGRAGRTGPGRCIRLYTRGDFETRAPFDVPEIQRADLCQSVLELKVLGITDPARFGWFEAPSPQALTASCDLLYLLGALKDREDDAALTALGEKMVSIPAHPRLARVLHTAHENGLTEDAATLAALISEGRLERINALDDLANSRGGAARDEGFRRARDLLLRDFQQKQKPRGTQSLEFCLLTGFPDRVAQKKGEFLLFSSGGSAAFESTQQSQFAPGEEWFVTLDVQELQHHGQTRSKVRARSLCPIKPEWLFDLEPTLLKDEDTLTWDPQREKVQATSKMTYDQLTLSESSNPPSETLLSKRSHEVSALLLKHGFGISGDTPLSTSDWVQSFSKFADAEKIEAVLAKISLLAKNRPELKIQDPAPRDAGTFSLMPLLRELFSGKSSLRELREMDFETELARVFLNEHFGRLASEFPDTLELASGRKAKIQYRLQQEPWIESRLQDFFGIKQGPSLCAGRIPLTLHLLAPNYRAVQVTRDLAGFWERAYPEVRRELSRRYPRHAWPENPLVAPPRRIG